MRLMFCCAVQFLLAAFVISSLGCSSDTEAITSAIPGPGAEDAPPPGPETPPDNDPDHPLVRIETSEGNVVIKLDAVKAPLTVKNFLWYASSGHYDGTIFHQVIDGYIALAGGYSPDLVEKPTLGFQIQNEAHNAVPNSRATIAMARQPDVIDSSLSQFYFNLNDNPQLDHQSNESAETYGYCVFGKVVEGLEILDRISKTKVSDRKQLASVPDSPITIKSVTRVY